MKRLILIAVMAFCALSNAPLHADDTKKSGDTESVKKEPCTCKENTKAGCGYCKSCHKGLIYGQSFKSAALFNHLHGKAVGDIAKIECDSCQVAAKNSGMCKTCKKYFANGRIFGSEFAANMARYTKVSDCEGCKKAGMSDGPTQCETCGAICMGPISASKEHSDAVMRMIPQLKELIATSQKCDKCAIGTLTGEPCTECNSKTAEPKKVNANKRDSQKPKAQAGKKGSNKPKQGKKPGKKPQVPSEPRR